MPAEPATPPLTPARLFLLFLSIAVQSFGGVLPFARRVLVARGLLTEAEFAELLALGQILPGPNIVNLSAAFGDRHAGWPGAAASVGGIVFVPTLIAMALAALAGAISHAPGVQGALTGMAAAAAGLLVGTAWRMAAPMRSRPSSLAVAAAIFAAVALARVPLALVLAASIPISLALHGALVRGRAP
ncbi:MAG: chromate transporter [Acetobacteraceae bacterium]